MDINLRKTTIMILSGLITLLGLWSILVDWGYIKIIPDLGMIVSILFIALVVSEMGIMSLIKKKVGALEIIGLSAVVLTLLFTILTALSYGSLVVSGASGAIKLVLIITGIAMIFTKQPGEKK